MGKRMDGEDNGRGRQRKGKRTVYYVTEDVKSTVTTIPFVKKNEFNYEWIVGFANDYWWLKWLATLLVARMTCNK